MCLPDLPSESLLYPGLIFLLMLGASVPAEVRENVTIRSCYDVDTCRTTPGEKIRLACIDTPERRGKRAQPERAKAARDRLTGMVVDRRTVGELLCRWDQRAASHGRQPPRRD